MDCTGTQNHRKTGDYRNLTCLAAYMQRDTVVVISPCFESARIGGR